LEGGKAPGVKRKKGKQRTGGKAKVVEPERVCEKGVGVLHQLKSETQPQDGRLKRRKKKGKWWGGGGWGGVKNQRSGSHHERTLTSTIEKKGNELSSKTQTAREKGGQGHKSLEQDKGTAL